MKKSDITKDVKRLSVEIFEYWEMELYHGGWFLLKGIPLLCAYCNKGWHERNRKDIIPVPGIRDCLNKLRDRKDIHPDYINTKDFDRSLLNIFKGYIDGRFTEKEVHYWLLSALLEVLKLGEE